MSDQPERKRRRGWDVQSPDEQLLQAQLQAQALAVAQPAPPAPSSIGTMPAFAASSSMPSLPNVTTQIVSFPGMPPAPGVSMIGADGQFAPRLPPVAGQDGNWTCVACQTVNFAGRKKCHLCAATKELSVGPGGAGVTGSEDGIDAAAGSALMNVAHLETEWDYDKLRWKTASYFRKAAKGVSRAGSVVQMVDEIAETAFSTIVTTLGDRPWLPQADFTLVLEAAVKQLLPMEVLGQIGASDLDSAILTAHDRASDQGRIMPLLWEITQQQLTGKKNQNKVYTALETSRIEALKALSKAAEPTATGEVPSVSDKVTLFTSTWIFNTVATVATSFDGNPHGALPQATAYRLFGVLLAKDMLPKTLTRELEAEGLALSPSSGIEDIVKAAYQPFGPPKVHRYEQKWIGPKTEMCWFFQNGMCTFGSGCKNAHDPSELAPGISPNMSMSSWDGGGCGGGFGGMGYGGPSIQSKGIWGKGAFGFGGKGSWS